MKLPVQLVQTHSENLAHTFWSVCLKVKIFFPLHPYLCTKVLTHGSLELRAFRKQSMQPFCRTVTPTSSLLADSRKSVIAVNILT